MVGDLFIAEQCVDLQSRTEHAFGRDIEVVTGRVLLHALDGRRVLCGHDRAELTSAGHRWDVSYLPHLGRCRTCAQLAGDGPGPDAGPASEVEIRTAHGTADENAGRDALRAVLDEHDLRRWMFTDLVFVDETIRGGLSHPLTVNPGMLRRRPALALATFLHEQSHWLDGVGPEAATAEARSRWPDPPPASLGGAGDPQSTWLHAWVCALEYQSLSEILGPSAAAAEIRRHAYYSWIYEQILADPAWFSGYLRRHGLLPPDEPPVPRRYFGEAWWRSR